MRAPRPRFAPRGLRRDRTLPPALLFVLLVHWSCSPDAPTFDESEPAGRMMAVVYELSSERYQGRGADSPGAGLAADYIEREMSALGLRPASGDRLTQPFVVATDVAPLPESQLTIRLAGAGVPRAVGEGWSPEGVSADSHFEDFSVAFWPDGVPESPRHGEGRPGRGFVALILEREAASDDDPPAPWRLNALAYYAEQARRALAAGAAGLLVSSDPWVIRDADEVNPPRPAHGYAEIPIPVIRLSSGLTRDLLEDAGIRPEAVSSEAGSTLDGIRVDLQLAMGREHATLRNVIGAAPGAGGWVLVGAHYDGLGRKQGLWQGEGAYHPGADDNASGVAVLMELARRLGHEDLEGRGLLFVAFGGEETGLAGSSFLAANPPVPLRDIAVVVNMDMVGRLGDGPLIWSGSGSRDALEGIVTSVGARSDPALRLVAGEASSTPSDHLPFRAAGVPVLHFMTAPHPDYHRLTDTWDKIDAPGLARVADFLEAVVDSLRRAPLPTSGGPGGG